MNTLNIVNTEELRKLAPDFRNERGDYNDIFELKFESTEYMPERSFEQEDY